MADFISKKIMKADQRGFTLLEVLIAMVIGTVGLLSLALMQANAVGGNNTGSRMTQATFLAQNMLENIKDGNMVADGTFGFIDMDFYGGPDPIESTVTANVDEQGNAGGPFSLAWEVAPNTDWSRRVTVTVSWDGPLGLTRAVQLESISRGDGN